MGVISATERRTFAGSDPLTLLHRAAPALRPAQPAPAAQRVVVFTDLSRHGTNAAWRAALVARDRKAALHLVSVQPRAGALPAVQAALEDLARELREGLQLKVSAQALAGELLHDGLEAARGAGLLVVAAAGGNLLGRWMPGSGVQRLIRRATMPVLVVKRRALTGYRSVIVPVDLRSEAGELIAAARRLSRDPGMKVFHVLGTAEEETMRLAAVPDVAVHAQRQRAEQRARGVLQGLIAAAGADADGAIATVDFGHPPSRVLEKEMTTCAELLVLGRPRRAVLAEWLVRSVTQRVLSATRADVLVVPLPPPGGTLQG